MAEYRLKRATEWLPAMGFIIAVVVVSPPQLALALGQAESATHSHQPVTVDVGPIISRMPVSLLQPRRVLAAESGDIFIADWAAGVVIKHRLDGAAIIVAENLMEPAGLAMDAEKNLYVSQHTAGLTAEGTVVKITANGEQTTFADGLTGPTGLSFGPDGRLYVANFEGNNILQLSPDGQHVVVADEIPSPAALAFDDSGDLWVVNTIPGTVSRVSIMGEVVVVAEGFDSPSDIAFDREGRPVVTNFGGNELSYIDADLQPQTYAIVPNETVALTFDHDGNLLLLNWKLRLLIKVTTKVFIDCPHCDKRIPLKLKTRPKNHAPVLSDRPLI